MEGYIGYYGYLIEERADGSFHVYGERAETKIFDDATAWSTPNSRSTLT